jgi:hypothetical protein
LAQDSFPAISGKESKYVWIYRSSIFTDLVPENICFLNGHHHYNNHKNYIVGDFSTIGKNKEKFPERIMMRIPRIEIQLEP